jgi:short subunit dehydrogenase-like uncharacterized protein
MPTDWMIYGASGYTGRLAAQAAVRAGEKPILAGRTESSLRPLADKLQLPYRVFDLAHPEKLRAGLEGIDLVLHCAGPFSSTSAPMVKACLAAKVNYLDITGELSVFESIYARHDKAKNAGVVLVPGVGFDVVPTDCLALKLATRVSEPISLELAFAQHGGSASPGTLKTMVENLHRGGWVRQDGQLVRVPTAHESREIDFGDRTRRAFAIPWGDISSAYRSTGIPNIIFYAAMSGSLGRGMKLAGPFLPLLGLGPIQRFLKTQIERRVRGPSEEVLKTAKSFLWGEVTSVAGVKTALRLTTCEGYSFTALSSVAAVQSVRKGEVPPGAWTPAQAFGAEFVTKIAGSEWGLS